jgi:hypothetical protein
MELEAVPSLTERILFVDGQIGAVNCYFAQPSSILQKSIIPFDLKRRATFGFRVRPMLVNLAEKDLKFTTYNVRRLQGYSSNNEPHPLSIGLPRCACNGA